MMALAYPALAGVFGLAAFLAVDLDSAAFTAGFAVLAVALPFAVATALAAGFAAAFGLGALPGATVLAGLAPAVRARCLPLPSSASISPAA